MLNYCMICHDNTEIRQKIAISLLSHHINAYSTSYKQGYTVNLNSSKACKAITLANNTNSFISGDNQINLLSCKVLKRHIKHT